MSERGSPRGDIEKQIRALREKRFAQRSAGSKAARMGRAQAAVKKATKTKAAKRKGRR